ncbi:S8 family serine peptidase [Streptomyces sp. NPDC002680]|uniref:S8 family serine peptidase n=1 Tax=Streptomyces sp. NPDC002680 TaxID=3364659 RepID=UPI0036CDAF43
MLSAVVTATAVAAPGPAQAAAPPAPLERWLVQLKDTVADPAKVAEGHMRDRAPGGRSRLGHVYNASAGGVVLKGYALEATADQIRAIKADPQVMGVERDQKASLDDGLAQRAAKPRQDGVAYKGDSGLSAQWGLRRIGAVTGADGRLRVPAPARVGVAVLDSGVDFNHPDLRVAGNVNFTDTVDANDFFGHGTHVAGIVQALNNGIGVLGTAPGTSLWNLKVLNDAGSGTTEDVIEGLEWVAQNARARNIRVANMSLTFENDSALLHQAVRVATEAGVAVVAAAGNENTTQMKYPAAYPEAISVAATTVFDQRAGFSNYGASWVDIAAPGYGILSTFPTHPTPAQPTPTHPSNPEDYGNQDGTSMAAPFVSGAAALCLTSGRCRGTDNVEATLGRDSLSIAGTGTEYRYGLLQATCYWQHTSKCSPRTAVR